MIRRLIGLEVTDVVNATDGRIQAAGIKSIEDLQRQAKNVIGFSDELKRINRGLKDFLFNRMYRHYRVTRMQIKADRLLSELFNAYVSEPGQMPDAARKRIDQDGLQRAVCDYMAGMTDRFALDEHAKMFDPQVRV
jgi:dGTPase